MLLLGNSFVQFQNQFTRWCLCNLSPDKSTFFLLPLFYLFIYFVKMLHLLKWIGCRLHLCSFVNYNFFLNLIHQCFISKAKHVINEVTIVLAVPFAVSIYTEYCICFIMVRIYTRTTHYFIVAKLLFFEKLLVIKYFHYYCLRRQLLLILLLTQTIKWEGIKIPYRLKLKNALS